jgi:hypothetical protein
MFMFDFACSCPTDVNWRQQWVVKLRRLDENGRLWQPGRDATVCSEHFYDHDFYYQFARKLIKPGALPTVFSFAPPAVKRKPPTPRQATAAVTRRPPNVPLTNEINSSDTAEQRLDETSDDRRSAASGNEHEVTNETMQVDSTASVATTVNSLHNYAVPSPNKLKRRVSHLHQVLHRKVLDLKNARRRECRLRGKVCNLLNEMKKRQLISDQASLLLEAYKDMPLAVLTGKVKGCYTDEQRQFACTLHYYSPKAYSFVRSKFKSMPNPRTIRRWLSAYKGQPGLTEESFNTISAANASSDSKFKICALTMDEMEIRKHIDHDRNGKLYGFIDLGCGPLDDDSHPQATKVLLVLAVGINRYWKLPLAYYLTNGSMPGFSRFICIGVGVNRQTDQR